jgi:hypothetical protein
VLNSVLKKKKKKQTNLFSHNVFELVIILRQPLKELCLQADATMPESNSGLRVLHVFSNFVPPAVLQGR